MAERCASFPLKMSKACRPSRAFIARPTLAASCASVQHCSSKGYTVSYFLSCTKTGMSPPNFLRACSASPSTLRREKTGPVNLEFPGQFLCYPLTHIQSPRNLRLGLVNALNEWRGANSLKRGTSRFGVGANLLPAGVHWLGLLATLRSRFTNIPVVGVIVAASYISCAFHFNSIRHGTNVLVDVRNRQRERRCCVGECP